MLLSKILRILELALLSYNIALYAFSSVYLVSVGAFDALESLTAVSIVPLLAVYTIGKRLQKIKALIAEVLTNIAVSVNMFNITSQIFGTKVTVIASVISIPFLMSLLVARQRV